MITLSSLTHVYYMKRFFSIFILACSLLCYASSTSDGKKNVHLVKKVSTNKPQAPTSVKIECSYNGAIFNFVLPAQIDYLDVTIANAEGFVIICDYVDAENSEIEAVLEAGEYTISCTNCEYGVFQGSIIVD